MKPSFTPCSFSKRSLIAVAQVDDRLHVHFVEGRENRSRRLRLNEPLGDARTQARHRHALLGPFAERRRDRTGGAGARDGCAGADCCSGATGACRLAALCRGFRSADCPVSA